MKLHDDTNFADVNHILPEQMLGNMLMYHQPTSSELSNPSLSSHLLSPLVSESANTYPQTLESLSQQSPQNINLALQPRNPNFQGITLSIRFLELRL